MNIIELTKEADIYVAHLNKPMTDNEVRLAFLERFAALVRKEALEEAAKVCEDIDREYEGEDVLATWCAAAIRGLK